MFIFFFLFTMAKRECFSICLETICRSFCSCYLLDFFCVCRREKKNWTKQNGIIAQIDTQTHTHMHAILSDSDTKCIFTLAYPMVRRCEFVRGVMGAVVGCRHLLPPIDSIRLISVSYLCHHRFLTWILCFSTAMMRRSDFVCHLTPGTVCVCVLVSFMP